MPYESLNSFHAEQLLLDYLIGILKSANLGSLFPDHNPGNYTSQGNEAVMLEAKRKMLQYLITRKEASENVVKQVSVKSDHTQKGVVKVYQGGVDKITPLIGETRKSDDI